MKNSNSLRFFFLTVLLCGAGFVHAQQTVSGTLLDAQTREPLPYVNIGIVGTSTGTVSGPDGTFALYLRQPTDSVTAVVKCSHIGYSDVEFPFPTTEGEPLAIVMEKNAVVLSTVQVSATQLSPLTVGSDKTDTRRAVSFSISKQPNQNLGAAVGKKIELGKYDLMLLDSVHFYITTNTFEGVRFRVNVHRLVDDVPGPVVHSQEVITELSAAYKGWVAVDFTSYELTLTEDFAVSVEWIYHSPKGKYLQMPIAMPVLGSTHYYRYGSQNSWESFNNMSAAISVSGRVAKKSKASKKQVQDDDADLSLQH